jgi:hypothetical protein
MISGDRPSPGALFCDRRREIFLRSSRNRVSPARIEISALCLFPSIPTDSTSGARKARSMNWREKGLWASEKSAALWISMRPGPGNEISISLTGETGTSASCPFSGTGRVVFRLDGPVGTFDEIRARAETREGSEDGLRLGISVQERDFDEDGFDEGGVRFGRVGTIDPFTFLALAPRRLRAACGVRVSIRSCAFRAARRSSKASFCSLIACAAEE